MPAGPVDYRLAESLRRARRVGGGGKPHDPFDDLRCAIVLQAMSDWLTGQAIIRKRHGVNNLQELKAKFPGKENWEKVCTLRVQYMMDAERFFNGEYCEDLCGVSGKLILQRLIEGKTLDPRNMYTGGAKKRSQKNQVA